jgi:hypothetical protein
MHKCVTCGKTIIKDSNLSYYFDFEYKQKNKFSRFIEYNMYLDSKIVYIHDLFNELTKLIERRNEQRVIKKKRMKANE